MTRLLNKRKIWVKLKGLVIVFDSFFILHMFSAEKQFYKQDVSQQLIKRKRSISDFYQVYKGIFIIFLPKKNMEISGP